MAFKKLLLNGSLIFIAAIAFFFGETSGYDSISDNYHLPDYVIPKHYNIKIIPLVEQHYNKSSLFQSRIYIKKLLDNFFIFSGESDIIIEILRPTHDIGFHILQSQIDIWSIKLIDSNGTIYKQIKYHYYYDTQILVLHFSEELSGHYTLNMKFTHIDTIDNINSFFRTSYKEKTENTSWIFATRFQAIGARRMFPCWDEPKFRTTFNISVKHHRNYTALSNMPIQTIETNKYRSQWTHFNTTFPISTYLVAIMVSKFNRIHTNRKVSILSRPSVGQYIEYANIIAEKIMSQLELEWEVMKKIPKMDHVAIPFWSDSLSNIGLILYREDSIIYDEKLDSIAHKVEVAQLIGYKMAYQLFGNIVSPSWWSYLWLHEGLSVLFGIDAINKVTHFQSMNLFIVQNQHESLQLNSYFPMNNEQVNSFSEINSLFYFPRHIKAFCILRMLQHLITDKVFRDGIHIYLDKHAFNSTTSDDLWKAMQFALVKSNFKFKPSIKRIMDSWLQQKHYPILRAIRNYDSGLMEISIPSFDESDNSSWWIPLSYTIQSSSNFNDMSLNKVTWLKCTPQHFSSIKLPIREKNDWIIINLQQSGYYRVNYDNRNWLRIATYLNSSNYMNIHILNRAKIIDDAFHFMVVGELNSSVFWNLTSYLSQETDFIAWYPMIKAFEYMSTIFPFSDKRVEEIKSISAKSLLMMKSGFYTIILQEENRGFWSTDINRETQFTSKKFDAKIYQMLDGLLKNIGFDENAKEDYFAKQLTQEAAKWACIIRHSQCLMTARIKFHQYLINPDKEKPLPWWQEWTYCNGLIASNIDWFHLTHDDVDNKFLGCSDGVTTVIHHLRLIANKRDSERIIVTSFHSIIARHARNNIVLEYTLLRFDEIIPRKNSTVATLIDIINYIYSEQQLSKISNFVKNNVKERKLLPIVQQKIDIRLSQINKQMNYIQIFENHM